MTMPQNSDTPTDAVGAAISGVSNVVNAPTPLTLNSNGGSSISEEKLATPPNLVPNGYQFSRRFEWVNLDEQVYPGMQFKMWVNFPKKLDIDMSSGEVDRVANALATIVVEHNGWRDFDNNLYAQPNVYTERTVFEEDDQGNKTSRIVQDYPFWDEIPDEIAQLIIVQLHIAVQKLPNSAIQSYRNSIRGRSSVTRRG